MSNANTEVIRPGLEGVVAFETEIAEPDREGGALRYRGVDIEELVGTVPFEHVWGLLVDGTLEPGLPPAEPHPLAVRSGDPRVDVQAALAMLGAEWGFGALIDTSDEEAREQLARASVMALSFVAQSARGIGRPPVPQRIVDEQPPHVLEGHGAHQFLDVDASITQRTTVTVGFGDLALEGDDALKAWTERRVGVGHDAPPTRRRARSDGEPVGRSSADILHLPAGTTASGHRGPAHRLGGWTSEGWSSRWRGWTTTAS